MKKELVSCFQQHVCDAVGDEEVHHGEVDVAAGVDDEDTLRRRLRHHVNEHVEPPPLDVAIGLQIDQLHLQTLAVEFGEGLRFEVHVHLILAMEVLLEYEG